MSDFNKALKYLLTDEGGFSNDKADRGGATRFGITRAEASRWLKRPVSVSEMQTLPQSTAEAIYFEHYWMPLACDKINSDSIATCLFDLGVVRGISVPPKYAQLICNQYGAQLVVDGHMGPLTVNAIDSMNPGNFVRAFALRAEAGFRAIVDRNPSQGRFLRGWVARAHRLNTLV